MGVIGMSRKQLSMTIDEQVLKKFKRFCEDQDINMSKRVERYMRKDLGMGEE